jgi:hypothetical protein
MPTRVVILVAGLAGLELTTGLADEFGDEVHVTTDRQEREAFEMIDRPGPSCLWSRRDLNPCLHRTM